MPNDVAHHPRTSPPRPSWWPHFTSTLRSTAVTARVGLALGIAIGVCLLTGLISLYHYAPASWLPIPAAPRWAYRVTQGLHVATGTAAIPLVLVKLWSVYPNLFRWPPVRTARKAVERLSVAVLVSATLVQLTTGFFNTLGWYPFRWDFVSVHHYLAYVVAGSVLLHVGVKLPDIAYGLKAKVADGDVLSEIPWDENPESHSNAGPLPPPATPAISRRGMLTAAGAGVGVVVATSVGQTLTPLEPIGLLAVRQPGKGPQGLPVNRTAEQAGVISLVDDPTWRLVVDGRTPFTLNLAELEALPTREAEFPIACVEGWSANARWRGVPLMDIVARAGGSPGSVVALFSVERGWPFNHSSIFGPQLDRALLATHLNGERLNADHGYPVRLISPNRPGVLNTKWLGRIEVR